MWMKTTTRDDTAKPTATSQNERLCSASCTVQLLSSAGSSSVPRRVSPAVSPPSGLRPTSSGRCRTKCQAIGATTRKIRPMPTHDQRQLMSTAMRDISGASTNPAPAEPSVKYISACARR